LFPGNRRLHCRRCYELALLSLSLVPEQPRSTTTHLPSTDSHSLTSLTWTDRRVCCRLLLLLRCFVASSCRRVVVSLCRCVVAWWHQQQPRHTARRRSLHHRCLPVTASEGPSVLARTALTRPVQKNKEPVQYARRLTFCCRDASR